MWSCSHCSRDQKPLLPLVPVLFPVPVPFPFPCIANKPIEELKVRAGDKKGGVTDGSKIEIYKNSSREEEQKERKIRQDRKEREH